MSELNGRKVARWATLRPRRTHASLSALPFPTSQYARMLEEEGELLRGLLGPRDMERIWSRHIVNSAAVLDFMPCKEGESDVGLARFAWHCDCRVSS